MRTIVRRARPADAAGLTRIAHAAKRHWRYPARWMRLWRDDLTVTAEAVVADGLAALKARKPVKVAGLMNTLGAEATRLVPRQLLAKAAGMIFKPSH